MFEGHEIRHLGACAMTSPGALFAIIGGGITVLAQNEHLSLSYLIGVCGLALYHGSRALIVWVERKHEMASLKRQLGEAEKRDTERSHELDMLRLEIREIQARHSAELQSILSLALAGRMEELSVAGSEHARLTENS